MDEITYQDPDSFRWFVCWRPPGRNLGLNVSWFQALGLFVVGESKTPVGGHYWGFVDYVST